jgi:hypothetical protein
MPIIQVNTDTVYSQDTADYLSNADRRITYGFRAALEMLHIPAPAFATRKSRRISDVLADYHTDNPVEAVMDRQRKIKTNMDASKADRILRDAVNV